MPNQVPENDPTTPDLPAVPGSIQRYNTPKLGPIGEVPDKTEPMKESTS